MGHNCSGWGGDPSDTQQGPQSSSLGLSLEWQAQHGTQGASASETRAGLWIHLLGLGTPGSSLWGHLGRPSGIIVPSPQWTRRAGGGQCHSRQQAPPAGAPPPLRGTPNPSSVGPPGAVRLYLHVHGADVARLVLSDPQLPVFGWVHFSKQLVHRLNCLQGMEKEDTVGGRGGVRGVSSELCHSHPCARHSSSSRALWGPREACVRDRPGGWENQGWGDAELWPLLFFPSYT